MSRLCPYPRSIPHPFLEPTKTSRCITFCLRLITHKLEKRPYRILYPTCARNIIGYHTVHKQISAIFDSKPQPQIWIQREGSDDTLSKEVYCLLLLARTAKKIMVLASVDSIRHTARHRIWGRGRKKKGKRRKGN